MSNRESSLSEQWVARIFAVMRATYGIAFDRCWAPSPGVDPVIHMGELRAYWARELAGATPHAIRYALENLPEHPPNLVQFKALCSRRPEVGLPALPAPKADPERVRAVLGRMAVSGWVTNPRGWADRLKAKAERGESLTPFQRQILRDMQPKDEAW